LKGIISNGKRKYGEKNHYEVKRMRNFRPEVWEVSQRNRFKCAAGG
jgi:hypothetical protein